MLTQRKGDIFEHRKIGEQGRILEQVTDSFAQRVQFGAIEPRHIAPLDENFARIGRKLAGDMPQEGGLAGAARPHQRDDFAARNIQIDALENRFASKLRRQPADTDQRLVGNGRGRV